MSFCRGLATYISARKVGLVGSIYYPSDRISNLLISYLFIPETASRGCRNNPGRKSGLTSVLYCDSAVVSPAPLLIADRKFVVRWAGKWRECMKNKPNFRASELETLSLAKKHSSIIIQLTV